MKNISWALLALVSCSLVSARAATINVTGSLRGTVNSAPFQANLSGTINQTNPSGLSGSETIEFTQGSPSLFGPRLAMVATGYKCRPWAAFLSVSDGSYSLHREWTTSGTSSSPAAAFTVDAAGEFTSPDDFEIDFEVNGTFPTLSVNPFSPFGQIEPALSRHDLAELTLFDTFVSYRAILIPDGPGSVREFIDVEFDNGETARSEGFYTYVGDELDMMYVVEVAWPTIEIEGNLYKDTFISTFYCVPDSGGSAVLLSLALPGLLWAVRRKRTDRT